MSALYKLVCFAVDVCAAGQTRRLEENVVGVFQAHRLEYFAIAVAILSYLIASAIAELLSWTIIKDGF